MNKKQYKLNKRNSKILHQAAASLGALKGASSALQEMHINEIQIHLLDEDGDGVVLCLEYVDEQTEELKKTFHSMEEYYTDDEDEENTEASEDEALVPLSIGEIDACASPENV